MGVWICLERNLDNCYGNLGLVCVLVFVELSFMCMFSMSIRFMIW